MFGEQQAPCAFMLYSFLVCRPLLDDKEGPFSCPLYLNILLLLNDGPVFCINHQTDNLTA
jgi:hypothetical protein